MFTKNSWGTSLPTLSKLGPTFLLLPFTLNRFVKPLPWHMDKQLLKFNPSYEVLWLLPQLTVKFLTEILHPTDILKADSTCFHQHSRISSASGPFWWYMARRVATIAAADTNPCLSSLLPPKKRWPKKVMCWIQSMQGIQSTKMLQFCNEYGFHHDVSWVPTPTRLRN